MWDMSMQNHQGASAPPEITTTPRPQSAQAPLPPHDPPGAPPGQPMPDPGAPVEPPPTQPPPDQEPPLPGDRPPPPMGDPPTEKPMRLTLPPEIGGPKGPEPTRYGDWEQKGRVTDF